MVSMGRLDQSNPVDGEQYDEAAESVRQDSLMNSDQNLQFNVQIGQSITDSI
jgi:hypothetical protein